MKTFPSKVEWIAEHQNGDKCYYYPGTGWVNAANGLVRSFDVDFEEIEATPEGATHVQIVNGLVSHVRVTEASVCVDVWCGNHRWMQACTLSKLPGTVVRIADGSVLGHGLAAKAEQPWVEVAEGWPADDARYIEVQLENGRPSKGRVSDFNSGGVGAQLSVVRWRYAS